MDCIRCGRTTEYDRVAVSRASGSVAGSLCLECEGAWMNGQAESTNVTLGECFECGDQPEFFFPQWDSIVESDDGAGSVETEYRIRLTTPCSCSQCAEE